MWFTIQTNAAIALRKVIPVPGVAARTAMFYIWNVTSAAQNVTNFIMEQTEISYVSIVF